MTDRLTNEDIQLYDYDESFDEINRDVMDRRDYSAPLGKSVCMAECLSPTAVSVKDFFCLFVPTKDVESAVQNEIRSRKLDFGVTVNPNMFC